MPGLGDIVQKALYLGVGLASYATEKAGVTLEGLRGQAQKLADEMVARGEMTTEEARKYVDELVKQAQKDVVQPSDNSKSQEPRLIEIVSDDEESDKSGDGNVDLLRQQVEALQEELRKLKRD